jgi:hypothetical protein
MKEAINIVGEIVFLCYVLGFPGQKRERKEEKLNKIGKNLIM